MSKPHWLVVALICSFVATPTISNAQAADSTRNRLKEDPEDFVRDVLRSLLGPNWNTFVHGGFTTTNRFLLQVVNPIDGQRALESSTGYNLGLGAGVDILLRMGFRGSYTFTSNTLNFRTDNGDGSTGLNMDDVGTIKTHSAVLEVMRYMLPTGARINPYGTLGFKGMWWALSSNSPIIQSSGAGSPFSFGPLASFGVQFKATDKWSGRLEGSVSSGSNPFTGGTSYRALGGLTVDKPTGVSHTDYRFAAVYHFSKDKQPIAVSSPVAHK
jgi:hypothetical protein